MQKIRNRTFSAIFKKPKVIRGGRHTISSNKWLWNHILAFVLVQMCAREEEHTREF